MECTCWRAERERAPRAPAPASARVRQLRDILHKLRAPVLALEFFP